MGEMSLYERLLAVFEGPYRLWVAIAVMTILGSIASAFTFCIKRKRADDAIRKRKKTDESSPDDQTVVLNDNECQDDSRTPPASTADYKRLNNTEVLGENGIHPIISQEVNTANNISEQEEGVAPSITGVKEEENGIAGVEGEEEAPKMEEEEEVPPVIRETDEEGERDTENGIIEVTERDRNLTPEPEPEEVSTQSAPQPLVNGISDDHAPQEEEPEVDGDNVLEEGRWSFPPKLEDFDLMETDIDPSELELTFADERLVEIYLELESDSPGLGISIVGGSGSPSGDLPIIIKRVLPNSLAERDGRLKSGDELVAVNDSLLVGVAKDVAIETLSNISGRVRLLVLQDD